MTVEKKPYPFTMERPPAEGRAAAFLSAFSDILRASSYRPILDLYSRITLHCSRCSTECMLFEASGDPADNPCYRSSILLRIYRRHFTPRGRLLTKLTGGIARTERDIDEMTESYYHCTACGRCTRYCPFGIDHRLVVRLGRYVLSETGIVPKNLSASTREQLEGPARNTSGLPLKVLRDNLSFLEEEIREIKGVSVRFPVDVMDAEYVFFAPVSDYIMEAETLMGIACVLHEAGVSWTIASGDFDAINYGLFYSDARLGDILRSMVREVRRLKGRKILVGECGHAYRSMRDFLSTYDSGEAIPVEHVLELTSRLIEEKRIELDPAVISERVTYHDPCNIARSGWIVDQPRAIIRSFIRDFAEMDHAGIDNYCCGGGGGTVAVGELKQYRMEVAGRRKAEQLRKTGAGTVIAPCANCKKQIRELIAHYRLPLNLAGMHDLIFSAIKIKRTE
ncbi:MAG TPA: (Fe-S)-binding protein [Spirochaetota bacterium]|nr:(Fe-S)-binding protein [Spirochaetota bacterium]HPV39653.1 (Fe-S)-binding protein [Spirochaetota bacterium]